MRERQVNSTTHPISFLMVLSSDHITPATGKTPTVAISKDGGAFTSPAGVVSEIGNGWYSLSSNATDRNTLGSFLVNATATGCDPCNRDYTIVGYDPFNATSLGLTNLDATVSSRLAASAYTAPLTVAQIATGLWTDATAGDFTVAGSAGHALMNLSGGVGVATEYKPGDTFLQEFTINTGAGATNADSLPTCVMAHNGTDDGTVTLTVAAVSGSTGRYKVSGTIPSGYSTGDKVQVFVTAAINALTYRFPVGEEILLSATGGAAVVQLDLTQPLVDVSTATVGGALHASWAAGFGKMILDTTGAVLKLFGIGSQSVPLKSFTLDSGTSPTTRTPQ